MNASPADLQRAVELLRAGELVAFPTETVYGLGADASNASAVAKIFAAKGRPADHPLIVHLPSGAHLARWARDIPVEASRLAAAFWPGPLTLILKRQPSVPEVVTGGQDTVGLRVPNHPLALELLKTFSGAKGDGLAAPSANRFGRISPTTAAHVREELGERVPLVLDGGPCAVGIESTIVDVSRGRAVLLRPGAIGVEDLTSVLGYAPEWRAAGSDAPRVSGALQAHYAPRTPLQLLEDGQIASCLKESLDAGERVAVFASTAEPIRHPLVKWIKASADPLRYAHDLYATLRALDGGGFARILVQARPDVEAWRAVNDRLRRAAAGSGEDDET